MYRILLYSQGLDVRPLESGLVLKLYDFAALTIGAAWEVMLGAKYMIQ